MKQSKSIIYWIYFNAIVVGALAGIGTLFLSVYAGLNVMLALFLCSVFGCAASILIWAVGAHGYRQLN